MKEEEEKAQAEKKERDAAVLDFDPDAEEAAEEDAAEEKSEKSEANNEKKNENNDKKSFIQPFFRTNTGL